MRQTSVNLAASRTVSADAADHSKHLQYIGDFFKELPLAKIPVPEPTAWHACAILAMCYGSLARTPRRRARASHRALSRHVLAGPV